MPPLAPAADRVPTGRPPGLPQQATHRVPQQVDVRRVVNAGLDHERVTSPAQWLARLFFATLWPLSTTSRPTADNSSGVNNDTLS